MSSGEPLNRNNDNVRYRERIYDVATQQFSEKGYRGTSMRDLGEALGLHAGSLYAHIKGKEDILFEIIERILKIHHDDMNRIMGLSVPPVEKLQGLIACHINLITENLQAATVYFHEWHHLNQEHRSMIVAKRDEFENAVREAITACIEDGIFEPLDVRIAAKAMLGMLNWTYQWYLPNGRLSAEDISERFASYIIDGFRRRPAAEGQHDPALADAR